MLEEARYRVNVIDKLTHDCMPHPLSRDTWEDVLVLKFVAGEESFWTALKTHKKAIGYHWWFHMNKPHIQYASNSSRRGPAPKNLGPTQVEPKYARGDKERSYETVGCRLMDN